MDQQLPVWLFFEESHVECIWADNSDCENALSAGHAIKQPLPILLIAAECLL
jgi:hypothetical protein